MSHAANPVLILGAGINGAAIARELVLNGVGVVVVDAADVCFGATAYSSRLIHGGLRYLEYGDFALVRESLAERGRLLRLAPQFVQPLRMFIPVERRWGGWVTAAKRFLFHRGSSSQSRGRGLWLIRAGLRMYDHYARDPQLPRHAVCRVGHAASPRVDPARYRWLCAYSDAQMLFPERFVLALLDEARTLAAATGVEFRLLNYYRVRLEGTRVELLDQRPGARKTETIEPAAIVNATGAWVDLTLREMKVDVPRLMAGTKGSHFVTYQPKLVAALSGQAVYAEAADGRPVFVLPFGSGVLVGTTDIPFDGRPEQAVATEEEIEYLLADVNKVFPRVSLTRDDLELHYCGVRPLPASSGDVPASVTRRHRIEEHRDTPLPLYSVIGGKLTTCRSLAEEAADLVFARLGLPRTADSRDRLVSGGEDYPANDDALTAMQSRLASETGLSVAQVAAAWPLWGTRLRRIAAESSGPPWDNVAGTSLPVALVRWMIAHEWVATLDDLVERRLMLLYHRPLTKACLRHLAELLVEAGLLTSADLEHELARTTGRLRGHFGKKVFD